MAPDYGRFIRDYAFGKQGENLVERVLGRDNEVHQYGHETIINDLTSHDKIPDELRSRPDLLIKSAGRATYVEVKSTIGATLEERFNEGHEEYNRRIERMFQHYPDGIYLNLIHDGAHSRVIFYKGEKDSEGQLRLVEVHELPFVYTREHEESIVEELKYARTPDYSESLTRKVEKYRIAA